MRITLTGATGFVGGKVVDRLLEDGHELRILARKPAPDVHRRAQWFQWDATAGPPPEDSLAGADAVVHLAGEPVTQRWNPAVRERIRASRLDGTRNLVAGMKKLIRPPATLVSASATGYYGSRGDEILTEDSSPGSDFLAELCAGWEAAAREAEAFGTRVAMLRIGVVLGHGGALAKMVPAFRAGVGGRLGSGKQWMSWIHIDDLTGLIAFALERDSVRGPVNACSPNPVTNATFTRELGRALGRPAILPVPAIGLRLLFGEVAGVMLASQRVQPRVAQAAGYGFAYPEIAGALARA
jgi:uncharacterized protein (TIGR01777 family)